MRISKTLFETTRFALEILHGLKPLVKIRIQRDSFLGRVRPFASPERIRSRRRFLVKEVGRPSLGR